MRALTGRVLVVLYIGLCTETGLAAIRRASSEAHQTTRGDQITLAIEGDHDADAIWFTRGQKLCKGAVCVVETGELRPGEYQIDVLIKTELVQEIDALHFRVTVEASPPLYRPQAITAELRPVQKTSAFTHISAEDLWLTAIQGRLIRNERQSAKTVLQTSKPSPAVPASQEILRVPHGSIALSTSLIRKDFLVIDGPAELKRIDTGLMMHSGQFLWRRLPMASGSTYPMLPLTTYATISSSQPGDTYIRTGVNENHPAVDIFAIGSAVAFQCGKELLTVSESERMTIVYEAKNDSCTIYSRKRNTLRQDLAPFYKETLGHWFDQQQTDIWRFWVQPQSTTENQDQLLALAATSVENHQWGFAMDSLSAVTSCNSSVVCLVLKGQSTLALGLLPEAEKSLTDALILNPDDPDAAFQMARYKYSQKNYSDAMNYYELAARNGYRDFSEAKRRAAIAAEAAGLLRLAMIDLEGSRFAEQDPSRSYSDLQNRDRIQNKRPWSGHMEGLTEVQSHVLPINPGALGELPNAAATNRGLMSGVRGAWQRVVATPKNAFLRIAGKHDYVTPLHSAQIYGSHSDHSVMIEAKSVHPPTIGFDTSLALGTQIRGGARQVDALSAKLGMIGEGSSFQWNAGLLNRRALDPAPGGNDTVDARIDRYIEPTLLADHSHFDFGLTTGVESLSQDQRWQLQLSYQTIDFRTGVMDDYDATEISFDGTYQKPFYQRYRVALAVHQWQRNYQIRGKDQWFGLDVATSATVFPLWDVSAYLGYFTRSAADEVATYQGHHYGLGVSVLL